jgi:peptide subunit release factor 1 (eRF1)
MLISSRRRFSKPKLLHLLDELEAASDPATSFYIPAGILLPEMEKTLHVVTGREDILPDVIIDAVTRSKTGAVLFWGEQEHYMILPPFPVTERLFVSGYDVELLRSLLQQDLKIALILLRLGFYAIGVFEGQSLLSSKVGTGHIHSQHRKGGSSQRRFARRREKEMEYFFERVCGRVQERLEPYIRQLDYLVYGGERHTLLAFRKRCEYLKVLDNRVFDSTINVREPKQASLEAAIDEVWSSDVIRWSEQEA